MRARAPPRWAWVACVVLVVVAGVVNCESLKKTPTIVTKYGQLRGFFRTVSGYGLRVATYLGVPYATPPVGANRFSPTRTLSQWVGVHEATHFGPACPQRLPDITNETAALSRLSRGRLRALRRYMPALRRQSEDCLYLNLYVPDEGRFHVCLPLYLTLSHVSCEGKCLICVYILTSSSYVLGRLTPVEASFVHISSTSRSVPHSCGVRP